MNRHLSSTLAIAAALVLAAGAVMAQPGGGPGPGPGPAASGPRMGPGMGPGMGMGRWGSDFTPGWSLMTPQERDEHRERMRNAKTYEECKAVQQQHHDQMAARAKERGGKPLAQPRRDACAGLKR